MAEKKDKIVVMGSFIVDLMARTSKLPKPGETVLGSSFQIGPGGKGSNQAIAAKRAGSEVTMVTKLGDDEFAHIALENFEKENIPLDFVYREKGLSTGTALIMVDENSGQNKIVVTPGANNQIKKEDIEKAKDHIANARILLMQLETNLEAIKYSINIAKENNTMVILNPAPAQKLPEEILQDVDILTPNESEAEILCGLPVRNMQEAEKAAEKLLKMGPEAVIITLGNLGVYLKSYDLDMKISAFQVDVVDTTGAGDAYNGALACALAEGKGLREAAIFANAAGAQCTTKIGTAISMPFRDEIKDLLNN